MKTPPPWTIYDDADPLKIGIKGFTRQIGSVHVATVIMPENAELIIKAVNNHDALVKALEDIVALHDRGKNADTLCRRAEETLAVVGGSERHD